MKRREFLTALAPIIGAPALIGLTNKAPRAIVGGFVDDGGAAGHRLRNGAVPLTSHVSSRKSVVIVGAGMAGLSAAWELERRGMKDYVILEMERAAGGNSRSGENEIGRFPWGAHYVPVPGTESGLVRELFVDLGALRDGTWEERYLCFSPQERLFLHGEWQPGVEPEYALDAEGRAQFLAFDEEIERLRATRAFTIPMATGAPGSSPLDGMSMAQWMNARKLTSPALRWYVDYACRDDYGAHASNTSAWAGLHYFASRSREESGPLTWSEGNAWITTKLAARAGDRLVLGDGAVRIERRGQAWTVSTTRAAYTTDAVVFAAPTFLLPHLVPELREQRAHLTYSPWLTANLTLERAPRDRGRGAPPSWENVLFDSRALGYVIATHQSLRTRGERSVWTYYWALADGTPDAGRRALQQQTWGYWTEAILADLERAHPDVRQCVSRVDIMRMGHAMVRPTVGFLRGTADAARLELPGLYLANSDLSGLSLFEEAQYRGVMAARGAMRRLGRGD